MQELRGWVGVIIRGIKSCVRGADKVLVKELVLDVCEGSCFSGLNDVVMHSFAFNGLVLHLMPLVITDMYTTDN